MFHFKKNIWLLFYLVVFIGTTLLASTVYIKHEEILNETKHDQLYLTKIYHNHLNALFTEHEILHNLIGNEYLKDPNFNRKTFANVLKLNPLLLDIAIFSKQGDLQLSTLFPVANSRTNLLENSHTRPWFQETLDTERMVIGKPYLLQAINKWILPIRKKITDSQGETLAVISTGIDLAMLTQRWYEENNHQSTMQATLDLSLIHI